LIVSFELFVISVNFQSFLIESGALARWTVWVVFSIVHGVVFRWQFNDIGLIKVWCCVSLSLLGGEVYAVKNYFLALRLAIEQLFLLQTSVLIAHAGVELMNWLEIFAEVFEPWPLA
jgi:hypothetical protein